VLLVKNVQFNNNILNFHWFLHVQRALFPIGIVKGKMNKGKLKLNKDNKGNEG